MPLYQRRAAPRLLCQTEIDIVHRGIRTSVHGLAPVRVEKADHLGKPFMRRLSGIAAMLSCRELEVVSRGCAGEMCATLIQSQGCVHRSRM
jgi:hypothetical protein